ncbi:hypothetical protein [Agrococcus jejuensis]|uniref:hypothetical protein n=1 Tax=Agrococcus jejuensis TaxID=399736 RepID=UPI0011A660EC|nr:hypothetical protein [Agrococcus jejuensis]
MADRTRILTSAASIASTGAFTLIPIGRASAPVRWGVGAALSLVPAAVAAVVVDRRMRDRATPDRVVASAGAGVAFGAVSLAAWEASARVDRAVERSLVRRRVRRPRVVMAVGAAALAGGIELLDVLVSRRSQR